MPEQDDTQGAQFAEACRPPEIHTRPSDAELTMVVGALEGTGDPTYVLGAELLELRQRAAELEAQRPRIERRLGNVDALPPGSQIIDDDGTPALKVADLPIGATDGDGYRSEWTTMGGIVGTYDFAMPVTVLHEPAQEDDRG